MSGYSRISITEKWRPLVPKGDDPEAARAVANTVLERLDVWTDELRAIAEKYHDAAPESSAHALGFSAAISRAFFVWVEQWPQ
jgi:hypothetical protein